MGYILLSYTANLCVKYPEKLGGISLIANDTKKELSWIFITGGLGRYYDMLTQLWGKNGKSDSIIYIISPAIE